MRKDKKSRTTKPPQGDSSLLVAQVILRAHSGKRLSPETLITSENIAEYQPSREDTAVVKEAFRAAGFETGEMVGISFSIAAPLARFEQYFGIKLGIDARGAIAEAGSEAPSGGFELPLNHLPAAVAERVEAVAFTPPAELHGQKYTALF